MSGRSFTVTRIGDELFDALKIREALEGEDPQLVLDMIEGSTNLQEAVCVVAEEIGEDEILLVGLKAHIAKLTERKSRIEKSIEDRRNIILSAMDRADIPTIKSPTATLTKRPTAAKVVVTDESLVPARFFIPQDPKLDKEALTEAVKALGPEESIPGAAMSNGGISLTIRRA